MSGFRGPPPDLGVWRFGAMKDHRSIQTALDSIGRKLDSLYTNPTKELILGVVPSGAKFTPLNHKDTGDEALDTILRGDHIPVDLHAVQEEMADIYQMGIRYFHWHARNPETREQSSDNNLYRKFGSALRRRFPDIAVSFGGSRNGKEIVEAIRHRGEWERLSQAALSREEGGADFVTIQAAAELMIAVDMERQGYLEYDAETDTVRVLKSLESYVASETEVSLSIGAHSTSGGADYGKSTVQRQMEVFRQAIECRGRLGLPQEVEWTQLQRSYLLTRIATEHLKPGLGNTGRLNITILFGFSPKLPFPLTYGDFKHAIQLARSIGQNSGFPALDLSISVGAAVLPQKARDLFTSLDIGPDNATPVSPLERLTAYACQLDSDVDLLRFGMEDTPYLMDEDGEILPATNTELAEFILQKVEEYGALPVTDPVKVRNFVTTERRGRTPLQTDD